MLKIVKFSLENEFFPPELLQEEERLKTEHENIDKMSLVNINFYVDIEGLFNHYKVFLLANHQDISNCFTHKVYVEDDE